MSSYPETFHAPLLFAPIDRSGVDGLISCELCGEELGVKDYRLRFDIRAGESLSSDATLALRREAIERDLTSEKREEGRQRKKELGIQAQFDDSSRALHSASSRRRKQSELSLVRTLLGDQQLVPLADIVEQTGLPKMTLCSALQTGRLSGERITTLQDGTGVGAGVWGTSLENLQIAIDAGQMKPREGLDLRALIQKLSDEQKGE